MDNSIACVMRLSDGTAAIETAVGPSQYGHTAIMEMVEAWEARGSTPRSKLIRRECARAALSLTGENFAKIGARIQCTRAAISAGVREFCDAHKIPNRAGRSESTRLRCKIARYRVFRGGSGEIREQRIGELERALEALRGCNRKWIAQQCGVTDATVRKWFLRPGSSAYIRPIRLGFHEKLSDLSKHAARHPIIRGRKPEKFVSRNSYRAGPCQKNFQKK